MNPSFDLTGSQVRQAREYPIAAETVIQAGQAVTLTDGLVVPAPSAPSAPILGIAAESHLGIPDAFNPRSNGKVVKVYDSPAQIYTCRAPEYAASGGTANTFTCAAKADGLKNGFAKLVDKTGASNNADPLGTLYTITASTSAGVITIDREGTSQIAAGDVFEIYPPVGYAKAKLSSGLCNISLDTACEGSAIMVAGHVTSLGMVEVAVKNIYA